MRGAGHETRDGHGWPLLQLPERRTIPPPLEAPSATPAAAINKYDTRPDEPYARASAIALSNTLSKLETFSVSSLAARPWRVSTTSKLGKT